MKNISFLFILLILSGCCSVKPEIKQKVIVDNRCYRLVSGYLLTDQDLAGYTDQDLFDSNDQWVKLPCLKTYLPMVMKWFGFEWRLGITQPELS